MGGEGLDEGLSLNEALDALGFQDVAAFIAWSEQAASNEVYAVAVQLLELMTQPAQ